MSVAFLFSGQGAQKPGMGREICDASPAAREVFSRAEAEYPELRRLCFDGPGIELSQTHNAQPCLVAVELALLAAAREAGLTPLAVAGFSLGEITALAAAGVFSEDYAVSYAVKRGALMAKCAADSPGGMAAILGGSAEHAAAWCASISDGWAEAVNFNAPGQTVAAGDAQGLAALKALAAQGNAKFIPLKVSGAFHSRAMRPAGEALLAQLSGTALGQPRLPWYPNLTGEKYDGSSLPQVIAAQTYSPVRFESTVREMIRDGITAFVELGPGGVLCGLIKRISPETTAFSVEDSASLSAAVKELVR